MVVLKMLRMLFTSVLASLSTSMSEPGFVSCNDSASHISDGNPVGFLTTNADRGIDIGNIPTVDPVSYTMRGKSGDIQPPPPPTRTGSSSSDSAGHSEFRRRFEMSCWCSDINSALDFYKWSWRPSILFFTEPRC